MSMARETLFELPTIPDEFGVILSAPELRRIDFSGLEYDTARRAILEYIKTYFPDEFNDFVASNGLIMVMEILASLTGKLSLRSDILANEAFLPTASTEEAVVNHLALINQTVKRQTPAIIDIEISVDRALTTNIEVPAGLLFNVSGSDDTTVTYEVFRAPGDFVNSITLPAGKRGVIAYGIEGAFSSVATSTSIGGPSQQIVIEKENILESPIFVTVATGNAIPEKWKVLFEPIERFGPNDKVVEVRFVDNSAIFRFGDDITGAAPLAGQKISIRYRVGGGIRGRIGVGKINEQRSISPLPPSNATATVNFRNITASSGGTDKESLESAKKRAPKDYAVHNSIVTAEDYAQVAGSFAHPAFGAVSKAVATLKSGLNANRIEVFVLSESPDLKPAIPNAGLKAGLVTYYQNLNVLTDYVVISDGVLHPIDVEMTVVIDRDSDATVVKDKVEAAVTEFFDSANWEMGQPFYISNFIKTIKDIDGVAYLDLFKPVDNILHVEDLALATTDIDDKISPNELIVEGNRIVNYYYEKEL